MTTKNFSQTEFVTLNFISDFANKIRDLLGKRQHTYSEIVNKTAKEILEKIEQQGEILWFRQITDRTFDSSLQVTIYGQYKVKE